MEPDEVRASSTAGLSEPRGFMNSEPHLPGTQVNAPPNGPGLRVDKLKGFRIGVTSDRRSEDLIAALERRGAQVLHAPALKIAPNDQDGTLVQETRAVIA